jgi:enoyl-CoA hydratase/carnithine racemase
MELTQITLEIESGVALITLNQPDRMNSMTGVMRRELIHTLGAVDLDDAVRAVVVTGAGRAFCAGADLSGGAATFNYTGGQAGQPEPPPISRHRDGGGQIALAAFNCRKPIIAAINGPAVGVGITMTLAMDMRIAAEDAKIGFVFAQRGVCLEACSSWFLPRIVGLAKAAEWALTGRIFKAGDESGSGLFNYVLPAAEVLQKALAIAREIAEKTAPVSVTINKALLYRGLAEPDPQSMHLIDSKCFFWVGQQPDAAEGIESFLEKRPPRFTMSPTRNLPDFYPWWREPKI